MECAPDIFNNKGCEHLQNKVEGSGGIKKLCITYETVRTSRKPNMPHSQSYKKGTPLMTKVSDCLNVFVSKLFGVNHSTLLHNMVNSRVLNDKNWSDVWSGFSYFSKYQPAVIPVRQKIRWKFGLAKAIGIPVDLEKSVYFVLMAKLSKAL